MYRIGHGVDYHRFADNRDLILGGVTIPYEKGLLGHSDADILTHTIMDALLGALALGSIGDHFPDTDPKFKGADSMALLDHVYSLITEKGYQIVNIDSVLIAQEPKLQAHISSIQASLAKRLNLTTNDVGVKATTTEKMGPEGRLEGMSCQASVLLKKS
ncbi:2-C-methyl-D-erythritol 2,4-cyclodiphosphate synthase [Candidatus Marinamargulisbacteria bacterium SCGC AAA071-K20]|nr:2-C-methyl-D-erythritol 2,4-cyclodiphosphate synthase [Candidatus Marinamargulisbacteria bacterium SCGC AAA071-K20]